MTTEPVDDRDKPSADWKRPPEPPLHRAARHGDLRTLQSLLDAGGDINEKADLEFDNGAHLNGLSTLMVAARSIDGATTETLRWLVEHGADLHARSQGGNSAAWYAAGDGGRWEFHKRAVTPDHVERLRYLLGLGLDPRECNFVGRSLITEACEAGDPARVRLLLERGVPVEPAAKGRKPGRKLSVLPWADETDAISSSGAATRGTASSFQIPLFCAARSGSAECVRLILRARADPNARDDSGQTALMVAGSAEVVRVLLEAGTDLHATDEYGKDAFEAVLDASCEGGTCGPERFEVAKALLQAGVDIERVDQYGKARLASAAFSHQADSVAFLLSLGAKVTATDLEGGTALHAICWQGEYTDQEMNLACEQIIRSLVNAGASVHARDHRGRTPMHEAARGDWGNQTAIRTLLELGAEADPADEDGNTPLVFAASSGEKECVNLLLQAGADPLRKSMDGRTALDHARDHVRSWESIVADGPDIAEAEEQLRLTDTLMEELAGLPDEEPADLQSLIGEQTERHQSALNEARESLNAIESAVRARTERA